ncbi:hypothetical protein Pmani_013754 [Petrolisthes manimaculis]|uniref:AAA+ ATPase domain-containing protein n=1 Tax=Petrolisthes manimaculis TaxID=1843537 RepID=A0AAE1PWW7_9EUCA|nr:hypothetical protein Pmani_013754 [Petrolisthes manimaculis]
MAPTHPTCTLQNDLKRGLQQRAKNEFSIYHSTVEGLEVRKLEMHTEHQNKLEKVQLLTLGKDTNKPTKIILLVGATGTGKTTLINAMVNFIYRVQFSDDFRLILIDDKDAPKRSNAQSQTDLITAYAFYNLPGMPFDYNYILIDTPGFGDTRGIQRDREMMTQLKNFLKQGYGIDQVDGVGFVTAASASRLTQTQCYVYDGLSSMFGKDIKDNIYIMATFADAKTPPVLEALKEADVHYAGFYKFNNSALYASNADDGSDSDSDDEDSTHICKLFWEMGIRSMTNFFNKLGKTSPASLTLTKEVLEERNKLQLTVVGLQNQITLGLGKLTTLNQERDMLSRLDDEMLGTADHTEEVDVPDIIKIDLDKKEHVTNCIKCGMTCHYPCYIPDDSNKMNCAAMMNQYCQVCPANCYWDVHKNMGFRYEHNWKKEQRTVQELLDRYKTAQKGKLDKEAAIKAIEDDINNFANDLIDKIKEAQRCVEKLEEIALKPNPLSTKEYIDLMIESEKLQKRHNFQKRVEMLEKLKQEVAVVQGVRGNIDTNSGEALLKHFHDLFTK